MSAVSKTVSDAIKDCWARLAKVEFERAEAHSKYDRPHQVEPSMARVEKWLGKAGAQATRWYFR